jgi:hypothetical protein
VKNVQKDRIQEEVNGLEERPNQIASPGTQVKPGRDIAGDDCQFHQECGRLWVSRCSS